MPLPGISALDRLEATLRDQQAPYGVVGDPSADRWPNLWELCTVHHTRSGRSKQPATISINAHPTGWQATLRDLTLSCVLPVESETLEGCFDALEAELRSPRPRWRNMRHGERASRLKAEDAKLPAPWEPGKRRS